LKLFNKKHKRQSTIGPSIYCSFAVKSNLIQPRCTKKSRLSYSRKQREPLVWFQFTTDQLQVVSRCTNMFLMGQ